MKRLLLLLLLAGMEIGMFAQKIGITGGLNYAITERVTKIEGMDAVGEIETDNLLGARTGLVLEYEYPAGVTVGCQALYSERVFGYTIQGRDEMKEKLRFLDLPFYLGYTYTIDDKVQVIYNYFPIKVFLVGGLSFGKILSGTEYAAGYETDTEFRFENLELEPTGDDVVYRTTDYMGYLSMGLIVGSARITVSYDKSLVNLENYDDRTLKFSTLCFSVAYVYDFNQKRW